MPSQKRLRSLDEFEPPAWHRKPKQKLLTVPMMMGVLLMMVIGAMLGLSI